MKKKLKKPVVQLTSLLDLLFVMIFVLLLQSKAPPTKGEPAPKAEPVAKVETPKKIEQPKKIEPVPPKPVKPTKISMGAIFHFYATAKSPSVPTGIYSMQGSYNTKSGELKLGGTNWVKRPNGYDMVPLSGVIDEKAGTFTGRIEFQGCKEFTLYRTLNNTGSPVAGKWEGSYTCSQGETGLTLTLK